MLRELHRVRQSKQAYCGKQVKIFSLQPVFPIEPCENDDPIKSKENRQQAGPAAAGRDAAAAACPGTKTHGAR